MIDLHTHTIFSDGALIPSEMARRAEYAGLTAIGLTDHGDSSNLDFIVPRLVAVAAELNQVLSLTVIPGIEITHVHPSLIKKTVAQARSCGAKLIIVHGETLAEPVAPGTNLAALNAGVDVLAHPGLITEEEVLVAREKGVLLEISARLGHCLANGHVAVLAKKYGAKLVVNTDSHSPGDLIDAAAARRVVLGAGLNEDDFKQMQENAAIFLDIFKESCYG